MTVNYPPPLLSTTTAHSSLLTSEIIPAVAKITGLGVGGERFADVRDEVAKYDIIEQKVYTLRLKIEAKGLHLMEQKVYTFCTIF